MIPPPWQKHSSFDLKTQPCRFCKLKSQISIQQCQNCCLFFTDISFDDWIDLEVLQNPYRGMVWLDTRPLLFDFQSHTFILSCVLHSNKIQYKTRGRHKLSNLCVLLTTFVDTWKEKNSSENSINCQNCSEMSETALTLMTEQCITLPSKAWQLQRPTRGLVSKTQCSSPELKEFELFLGLKQMIWLKQAAAWMCFLTVMTDSDLGPKWGPDHKLGAHLYSATVMFSSQHLEW